MAISNYAKFPQCIQGDNGPLRPGVIEEKSDWIISKFATLKGHLHCTSSLAAFEVSFPTLLLATHRYSPLSVLLTFVIVSCLLSGDKLNLESLLIADPSLVHDDIVGAGFPEALQDRVTLSPSVVVTF